MAIQDAYTLNANEIYTTLANFIISQQVWADNFGKHQTLVDKARVDGSLYGDKKLYYAADVLKTHPFLGDQEAGNLLNLDRPADPKVQAITLNVPRQIRLSLDSYLSKRAWGAEGAFSSFNSVMMAQMNETKKLYEGTLYNVFIGTNVSTTQTQNKTITLTSGKEAQEIGEALANLYVEMGDYSRDFNDYGMMRSYAKDQIGIIWNSKYVNQIRHIDLPTIFHKDGVVEKLDEDVLPEKYFGTVNSSEVAAGSNTGQYRAVYEEDFGDVHCYSGTAIPSGVKIAKGHGYIVDSNVICKVVIKGKLPPFMSAFSVGTNFFNPRSLTTNNYITFMHNTLVHFANYPYITVKKAS